MTVMYTLFSAFLQLEPIWICLILIGAAGLISLYWMRRKAEK